MPEAYLPSLIIQFDKGYATDLAPQVRELSHFERAENIIYEAAQAVRKVGGSSRINGTAITGSPDILGMYDYWIAGTSGTFTQKFMAFTSDSKIYKEDMDGTFDDITGAATIAANAIPVVCTFDDLLLYTNSAADTPLSWDGAAASVSSLAGSPPSGRGIVEHVNRAWIWGTNANPSRLYYSAYGDPETWSGNDSGFLDLSVNDGDRIIGAVSYKGSLVVFKGPNRGSIHTLEGQTPGDFVWSPHVVRGVALQTHNSIIPVGDDVWFISRRGTHSLRATMATGGYAEADLSRYQRRFFREVISTTQSNMARVWGINYSLKSCALWTFTQSGQSDPDYIYGISYIDGPENLKHFIWIDRSCFSAAIRLHPTTGMEEVVFGTTNGFCERQDTTTRTLASGSAYSMIMQTPQMILGRDSPRGDQLCLLQRAYLKSRPVGNWNVELVIERDGTASETYNFNQGTAGFLLGTDLLGVGILGGAIGQTAVQRLAGRARSATFSFRQSGSGQDAYLFELGVDLSPASTTHISS